MADGQKRNIPLGGYGEGMLFGLQPHDIPMPCPPHGILRFYSSAMWSCHNNTYMNCIWSQKGQCHDLKTIQYDQDLHDWNRQLFCNHTILFLQEIHASSNCIWKNDPYY